MKTYRTTIIVAISCLLIGRYVLTPKQQTKEVIKIVEVEKQHIDIQKKVITREVKKKDGTIVKETVETENIIVDTKKERKVDSSITKQSGSKLTLGLLAIVDASKIASPEYGATVSLPLIGNLNVQGLVTTDKRVGVGLSIGF